MGTLSRAIKRLEKVKRVINKEIKRLDQFRDYLIKKNEYSKPKTKGVYCKVCNKLICKHDSELYECGGNYPYISNLKKQIEICHFCAKDITKDFIEEA